MDFKNLNPCLIVDLSLRLFWTLHRHSIIKPSNFGRLISPLWPAPTSVPKSILHPLWRSMNLLRRLFAFITRRTPPSSVPNPISGLGPNLASSPPLGQLISMFYGIENVTVNGCIFLIIVGEWTIGLFSSWWVLLDKHKDSSRTDSRSGY